VETESNNNKNLEKKLEELLRIRNYMDIYWQSENKNIEFLKNEKKELETSSDVLQSLQRQLEDVLKKTDDDDKLRRDKTQELGKLKDNKEKYHADLENCQEVSLSFANEPDLESIYKPIKNRKTVSNVTV